MAHGRRHIGTSGWNYRDWRERFYPKGVRQADWLSFYADHFDTVEVNNSFYRLPTREHVARWGNTVGEGFLVALKVWRGITHYRKLHNSGEFIERYLNIVGALDLAKRGPLLLQLPPNLGLDLPRLQGFLEAFFAAMGPDRWKVAVEFRRADWLEPEVFRAMDRLGVAICVEDMPYCRVIEPNDVNFVYVRRHGMTGRYAGDYPTEQIQEDAVRVARWQGEGRDVYVYYNNDVEGHAVKNARELREALVELVGEQGGSG